MIEYGSFTNSFAGQGQLFLQALLLGACMAAVYDLLKIYRQLFGGGTVALFIQDVLFFSVCGFVTFIFMLVFNNGQVRIFAIAAQLAGAVIYRLSLGRLVMLISEFLTGILKKLWGYVKSKVLLPFFRWIDRVADRLEIKTKQKFYYILPHGDIKKIVKSVVDYDILSKNAKNIKKSSLFVKKHLEN